MIEERYLTATQSSNLRDDPERIGQVDVIKASGMSARNIASTYLHLVASLPCAWCGLVGYSQAAHDNVGKGKSIKACDLRTFPLCCDRPMQRGCHSLFDNYALVSRGDEERRFVEQAIARTQAHIALVLGWPKSVPMPKELKELLKNRGAKHD